MSAKTALKHGSRMAIQAFSCLLGKFGLLLKDIQVPASMQEAADFLSYSLYLMQPALIEASPGGKKLFIGLNNPPTTTYRVPADKTLWSELYETQRRAQATYCSWEVIAQQLQTVLEHD